MTRETTEDEDYAMPGVAQADAVTWGEQRASIAENEEMMRLWMAASLIRESLESAERKKEREIDGQTMSVAENKKKKKRWERELYM